MPHIYIEMNRIQEVIEEKGITKASLAKQLNKSKATLSLYTNNQIQPPIPVLFQIAKLLNVDPRELLNVNPSIL